MTSILFLRVHAKGTRQEELGRGIHTITVISGLKAAALYKVNGIAGFPLPDKTEFTL